MKLTGAAASRYFARPDPKAAGALIFGADAIRVALRRQELIAALIGPEGEAEMRLTRLPAADLRRDPAALVDATRASGFFPGPRAVLVEEATDLNAGTAVTAALKDWQEGDAQIVVTAGNLTAKSALRKLFEKHPTARSIGLYDDPPTREEIGAELARAGLRDVDPDAMAALTALSREIGPGDFRQTLEKLALYKHGDDTPATPADVAACAPASTEAALDDMLNIVADGRDAEVGPVLRRLQSQGANPVGLVIGATRHFRALYTAASDPGGPSQGAARLRPPVFGPRRDRLIRQAQGWGAARLEQALSMLTETDLALRSAAQTAPAMAMVERTLIRLAMLASRR